MRALQVERDLHAPPGPHRRGDGDAARGRVAREPDVRRAVLAAGHDPTAAAETAERGDPAAEIAPALAREAAAARGAVQGPGGDGGLLLAGNTVALAYDAQGAPMRLGHARDARPTTASSGSRRAEPARGARRRRSAARERRQRAEKPGTRERRKAEKRKAEKDARDADDPSKHASASPGRLVRGSANKRHAAAAAASDGPFPGTPARSGSDRPRRRVDDRAPVLRRRQVLHTPTYTSTTRGRRSARGGSSARPPRSHAGRHPQACDPHCNVYGALSSRTSPRLEDGLQAAAVARGLDAARYAPPVVPPEAADTSDQGGSGGAASSHAFSRRRRRRRARGTPACRKDVAIF